ncbi:MAG TPA: DUF3754 domain-containing protein [Gemmataceae bacterium]|nr:DUF3754 domain-containing protein [Gemmataceae bacterium]
MADRRSREHFIPLRKSDLVELLCAEKTLSEADRELFRQFCQLVSATFHFEYNRRLEELKAAYAPFDPDADTRPLVPLSAKEKQNRLNELYRDFAWLLERANFKHLSRPELEQALEQTSGWGINVDVDFSVFEHLAIFARGDVVQKRTRRRWTNFYRREDTEVPIYQRLALILKLRPHKRLGKGVDTECVYLKIFKDIPQLDVEMLLPGARVHFSYLDRGKVGLPVFSALGLAIWNIITAGVNLVTRLIDDFLSLIVSGASPSVALWGLVSGAFGYGYRSYYSYQQTKQRYHLTLTQSLYYQSLDSNSGVLFRLLDEAEEQDCREAFLAYFALWRFAPPQGWAPAQLDDFIERYLEQNAGIEVNFEIGDAVAKLERMRIVVKEGDRYQARPIAEALEELDHAWDSYFGYHQG